MDMIRFENTDGFIKDFETIINMDSASDNPEGLQVVAQWFQARFAALGMDAKVVFPGNGKVPCMEATLGQAPFDVMFLGHMDTVFATGEAAKRPFSIEGDKAFGPGVCDMKGGLLVALHALETLKAQGKLDGLNLVVAFNGDEEVGSQASQGWIEETARNSRHTLVYEPCRPGYKVVSRRKGGGWFHLTATGKETHVGADPHNGVNAVLELAHQTLKITQDLNNEETGTAAHVTVFHGGDKVNIMPAEAKASVDIRIGLAAEQGRVNAYFNALADTVHLEGARLSVEGHVDRPPLELTDKSQILLDAIQETGKALGQPMEHLATGGCSDGNFASAQGTPTIDGMGIVGANSHREDEYVELSSISPMVELTANLCLRLIP